MAKFLNKNGLLAASNVGDQAIKNVDEDVEWSQLRSSMTVFFLTQMEQEVQFVFPILPFSVFADL